jgi:DNA-directed RNA polymerase II subunit RPB4
MAPHAAPSREQPTASTDLEAGRDLKLGEFADTATLSLSEARIVLLKTIEHRSKGGHFEETENTAKAREYLDLFSLFKDLTMAEQVEGLLLPKASPGMENFERSQLKSLVPSCADEAKAIIPSLEKKVEDGLVDENALGQLCKELQRLKRQALL